MRWGHWEEFSCFVTSFEQKYTRSIYCGVGWHIWRALLLNVKWTCDQRVAVRTQEASTAPLWPAVGLGGVDSCQVWMWRSEELFSCLLLLKQTSPFANRQPPHHFCPPTECNANLCPPIDDCPVGYKLNFTREGKCCQTFECGMCQSINIEISAGLGLQK